MNTFLILEAGNITIGLFFLAIAIFIATRPFVRPQVKKFILFTVITVFTILVAGHYYVTTKRMDSVRTAFENGKKIECESRLNRKAAQSVIVSKSTGWKLEGDLFTNSNFTRAFHAARCIVKVKPKLNLPVAK
jgi:exopolysaccharide biosynthesis protein